MANITDLKFKHNGTLYSLTIDFDDEALMNEIIAFDVVANRIGGKYPNLSVTARVEIDPANRQIIVKIEDEEVFKMDVFENETQIETLIDNIPAGLLGDPITSCAIKAGVSSILGQAINCARLLEAHGHFQIVSEYLKCMVSNFGAISKTAMYRAFRCILRGG